MLAMLFNTFLNDRTWNRYYPVNKVREGVVLSRMFHKEITMNVYLVIFNPGQNQNPYSDIFTPLHYALESFSSLLLSDKTPIYLIATPDSAREVWRKIYLSDPTVFSKDDRLSLISVCKPFQGYGPTKVRDWLEQNLPDLPGEDQTEFDS